MTRNKDKTPEEILEKNLALLPKIFTKLDTDSEGEALTFWRGTKKVFATINTAQEQITGKNPGFSFGKIMEIADGNAGADPEEFTRLQQENAALCEANLAFAENEKAYQQKILALRKTLDRREKLKQSFTAAKEMMKETFTLPKVSLEKKGKTIASVTGGFSVGAMGYTVLKALSNPEQIKAGLGKAAHAVWDSAENAAWWTLRHRYDISEAVSGAFIGGILGNIIGGVSGYIAGGIYKKIDFYAGMYGNQHGLTKAQNLSSNIRMGTTIVGLAAGALYPSVTDAIKRDKPEAGQVIGPADSAQRFQQTGADITGAKPHSLSWDEALKLQL